MDNKNYQNKQKTHYQKKKHIFNLWPEESSPNLPEHRLWWGTGPRLFSSCICNYFPQIMNATEIIHCYQFLRFSPAMPLKVLLPLPGVLSKILPTRQIPIYVSKHFGGTTCSLKPSLISSSKSFSLPYYLCTLYIVIIISFCLLNAYFFLKVIKQGYLGRVK